LQKEKERSVYIFFFIFMKHVFYFSEVFYTELSPLINKIHNFESIGIRGYFFEKTMQATFIMQNNKDEDVNFSESLTKSIKASYAPNEKGIQKKKE